MQHQCVHTWESVQCTFTKLLYMAYRAYISYLRMCTCAYVLCVCVCLYCVSVRKSTAIASLCCDPWHCQLSQLEYLLHILTTFFCLNIFKLYFVCYSKKYKLIHNPSDAFIQTMQCNFRRKMTREIFNQFRKPFNIPKSFQIVCYF